MQDDGILYNETDRQEILAGRVARIHLADPESTIDEILEFLLVSTGKYTPDNDKKEYGYVFIPEALLLEGVSRPTLRKNTAEGRYTTTTIGKRTAYLAEKTRLGSPRLSPSGVDITGLNIDIWTASVLSAPPSPTIQPTQINSKEDD